MYTIIVPLDGSELSEQAVGLGHALAQALGGTLELLNVLEEPVLVDLMPGMVLPDRLATERYLTSVAEGLSNEIPIRTTVVRGNPTDEILTLAAAQSDTLIAMSTHSRSAIGRITFGSVADKIARGAACPVALVRGREPRTEWRTQRLLVPLDGSALAEDALPLAVTLTAQAGGEIHLLRVVPPFWNAPYMAYGPQAFYLDSEQIEEFTEQSQEEARAYLDRIANTLRTNGTRVTWEVRVGRPADEIIRVTETIEPDLVVMSSHGHGGVRRWALGSVADEVLHRGALPVVMVPRQASTAAATTDVALAHS